MIYTLTLNPAVDRELTVDKIACDVVLRATSARVDFGGKGLNVSRQLRSLGAESTAVGFLGGKAGELLQEGLQALGIAAAFVWVAGETRTNVSIVTAGGGQYIKINETGPTIPTEKQAELLDRIETLAQPGDWWALAGSLPPGVPLDFYAQIIERLHLHGALTLLDTSGEALRLGCAQRPLLVKPNAGEAAALTGLPAETTEQIARCAAAIRALGAQNVVISMGSGGALLQSAGGMWLVHSPPVAEKSPTGAGDALVGGLVWALSRGLPLTEALAMGVASGAAAASLPGTEVGSQAVIDALLRQVRITALPQQM